MPGIPIAPTNIQSMVCTQAAGACDDLIKKLNDQIGKLGSLRSQVDSAWQGGGGTELDQAVGARQQYLRSAVASLSSAAQMLRAAASEKH
jgi:uncharacterized protein YukE